MCTMRVKSNASPYKDHKCSCSTLYPETECFRVWNELRKSSHFVGVGTHKHLLWKVWKTTWTDDAVGRTRSLPWKRVLENRGVRLLYLQTECRVGGYTSRYEVALWIVVWISILGKNVGKILLSVALGLYSHLAVNFCVGFNETRYLEKKWGGVLSSAAKELFCQCKSKVFPLISTFPSRRHFSSLIELRPMKLG